MSNSVKILDCTLRDGGYYTNWDFPSEVVKNYIFSMNNLPIDYIEIGYRNLPQKNYFGEFYYCPISTIEYIISLTKKPLAIILNERDINISSLDSLLLSSSLLLTRLATTLVYSTHASLIYHLFVL